MALNVSPKTAGTNAFAPTVSPVIHTRVAAYWTMEQEKANAAATNNVQRILHVFKEPVSAHARAFFADRMLIVNQKTMQAGVDVALDSLRQSAVNVFHVSSIKKNIFKKHIFFTCFKLKIFPIAACTDYYCGQGAVCIVSRDGPTCKCPPGLLGNPFPGGNCATDQCSAAIPCSDGQVCIGGRCKHRCENVVCGVGATCEPHSGKCVCEPNFIGNPELLCMPRELYSLYSLI